MQVYEIEHIATFFRVLFRALFLHIATIQIPVSDIND